MKYMWTNKDVQDSVNMQTVNNDFVIRTEYNLKMMENLQRTSPKKMKRFRSAFTTDQVNYLEKQFKKFPYIGNAQRKEVSTALNIPERAIKIWFQNRRMKEKKDVTGKECDDEKPNRKSLEFTKDNLSNGNTPSANDQKPYSLPLLADVNKVNCDKMMVTNDSPCTLNTGLLTADSGFTALESGIVPNGTYNPTVCVKPQPVFPNNYMKSGEFSIDLCKKFKTETSSSPTSIKPLSVVDQDMKPILEQKPINYKMTQQMIPEDLSSNRKMNVLAANVGQVPNHPEYISVLPTVSPLYTQPYYTASGVVWKPVNMMSTTPAPGAPMAPTPMSNSMGPMPPVPEEPKKCCSCDCHVKSIPYYFQQQNPNPQYIITAVQFPNPSLPKF